MAKKKRKVPLRKCIITNDMKAKEELIRIVRTKEGEVFVDSKGKKNGRGAYVSIDEKVVEQARETRAIESHFKINEIDHIYDDLMKVVNGEKIE